MKVVRKSGYRWDLQAVVLALVVACFSVLGASAVYAQIIPKPITPRPAPTLIPKPTPRHFGGPDPRVIVILLVILVLIGGGLAIWLSIKARKRTTVLETQPKVPQPRSDPSSSAPSSSGWQPSSGAQQAVAQAVALLKQGKWQEARSAHQRLIDLNINKAAGFYGLGIVYLMTKDTRRAKESFQSCIENDPSSADAYYNLGLISEQENEVETARNYFLQAIRFNSNHHAASQKLASLPARRPADTSTLASNKTPLISGFTSTLEADAQSRSASAATAQNILSLMDSLRIVDRAPYASAFLGPIIRLLLVPVILLAILLFARIITHIYVPGPDVLIFLSGIGVIGFACIVAVFGILLKAHYTRYTIDEGRLIIQSGIVTRERANHELYRVHDLGIKQSFINRLTKDGTLWLKIDEVGLVHLRGLAKYNDLQTIMDGLRNLIDLLRMHPLVKGIVR